MSTVPVVDFHTHLAPYETIQPSLVAWTRSVVGEGLARRRELTATPEGAEQILSDSGVEYAVVLADYHPATTGVAPNERVAEYCGGTDRLIPFACINPHLHPQPAAELSRCIDELGMKGLKLGPTYGHFYPHDAALYPAYEVAQEAGIPVLVHTGISVFKGSKLKYGAPLFLDEIAVDFPDLVIVQAHSGRGFWYDEAFTLARYHENVYLEVSGLPPQRLLDYFPQLERLADKVLFGSDYPGVPSLQGNIEAIRSLPLTARTREAILGGNAARLLGLGGEAA
jgi:predicted TIM-barrel fold metal-dependent hydrolase